MGEFLLEQLTSLGVKAEKRPIGTHSLEGKEVDLPPVIIGQIGQDPKKVCVHSLHSHTRTRAWIGSWRCINPLFVTTCH